MKLVDILARRLLAWPEHAVIVVQDGDKELKFSEDSNAYIEEPSGVWIRGGCLGFLEDGRIDDLADDHLTAIVTRTQWQEAREALSKLANAEQPDWSEAPEGFDYFIRWPSEHMENHFYQLFGDRYVRDNGHYALVSCVACDPEIIVMKRPVASESSWIGEGLPPAGTVCELRNVAVGTEWGEATIVFASRNVVVWDWVGEPAINGLCTAYAHTVEMRPIRTPEQIAADERKQSIDEMCLHGIDAGDSTIEYTCAALYDAGYRKVKGGEE